MCNKKLISKIAKSNLKARSAQYENEKQLIDVFLARIKALKSKKRWQETDKAEYLLLKENINKSSKRCKEYKYSKKILQSL